MALLAWLLLHPSLTEHRSLSTALGGALLLLFLKPPGTAAGRVLGRWPSAFLVFAFLSSLWSTSPGVALQSAGLLLAGTLMTLQWMEASPAERGRARTIAAFLVAGICLKALHQRFVEFEAMGAVLPSLTGEEHDIVAAALHHKRVFSTLATPGSLAALLLLFLPGFVERALRAGALDRLLGILLALLAGVTLLLTGSVGAAACLIASWVLTLLWRREPRRAGILAAAGLLLLAGFVALRGPSHWTASSFLNRWTLWTAGFRAWTDLPVLGWGWGQFEEAFRSLGAPLSSGSKYAHNVILQVWVEGGAIGVLLLAAAVVSVLSRLGRSGPPASVAALTGAGAFLLFSMLDIPLVMPELLYALPLFLSEMPVRPGREWDPWGSLRRRLRLPAGGNALSAITPRGTFWPVLIVLALAGFWPPFRPWSLGLAACILVPAAALGARVSGRLPWGLVMGAAYFATRAFLSPSSLGAVRFLETLALGAAFLLWAAAQPRPSRAAMGVLLLPLLWSLRSWSDTATLMPGHGWRALLLPISWTDYSNPRTLAVLAGPVLVLLIAARPQRVAGRMALLYGVVSTVRLWSVAAFAGVAAGVAYLKGRGWSRTRKVLVLLGLLLAVLGARFLNPSPTKWSRFSIWRSAAAAFLEDPVFGPGPGVFPQAYERLKEPRKGWASRHLMGTPAAHCDALDLALGFGIVGVLLAAWGVWTAWRREKDRARRAAALAIALPSSVQIVFHSPQAAMVGAALLAGGGGGSPSRPAVAAAGMALGLCLSLFGAAAFRGAEQVAAVRSQDSGRLPEAYQALQRAERLDAWDARSVQATHLFEEEMYLRTGDPAWRRKSDDSFERMVRLEARDGNMAFWGARRDASRAQRTKDPADGRIADASWARAQEALPRSAAVLYEKGLDEVRRGLKDRAAASFADAVALEPAFARAWLNLGNLLRERGQRQAGLAAYRQALWADREWRRAPLAPVERDLVTLPDEARHFAERQIAR
jgi:O-antigen ligase